MANPLVPSNGAFAQDLHPWVRVGDRTPGARRLEPMRVVLVRHLRDSEGARSAFVEAGLPWPDATRELLMVGSLLIARRQPEEVIVTGDDDASIARLLSALVPGRFADAMALDLTHGMGVIEMHGPRLDEWIARLVDTSAIPEPGRASRCRLVDIAAVLLRLAPDCVRVIADRSLFPYLSDWLAFSHEGTFEDS
jgi:sarcosine oxidase gamma subunit